MSLSYGRYANEVPLPRLCSMIECDGFVKMTLTLDIKHNLSDLFKDIYCHMYKIAPTPSFTLKGDLYELRRTIK